MAEGALTENPPKTSAGMSKRTFLKVAAAGAAAAVIGKKAIEDLNVPETGKLTEFARFIPYYEQHDMPLPPDEIWNDIKPRPDYLFREIGGPDVYFDSAPDLLSAMLPGTEIPAFTRGILNRAAESGTTVVVGDVLPGGKKAWLKRQLIGQAEVGVAGIIDLAAFATGVKKMRREEDIENEKESPGIEAADGKHSRRSFLGYATAFLAGLNIWAIGPEAARSASFDRRRESRKQKDAITRILDRVGGILSHGHPEDPFIFFRNALMACKLLYLAQEHRQNSGVIPNIGFIAGANHAGIEDFLAAGREYCLYVLGFSDRDFLKQVAAGVGGAENAASIRLFRFPPDFDKEELFNANAPVRVNETRLIDPELKKLFDGD